MQLPSINVFDCYLSTLSTTHFHKHDLLTLIASKISLYFPPEISVNIDSKCSVWCILRVLVDKNEMSARNTFLSARALNYCISRHSKHQLDRRGDNGPGTGPHHEAVIYKSNLHKEKEKNKLELESAIRAQNVLQDTFVFYKGPSCALNIKSITSLIFKSDWRMTTLRSSGQPRCEAQDRTWLNLKVPEDG